MGAKIKRAFLKFIAFLFPEDISLRLVRHGTQELQKTIEGELIDKFLELLLWGMDLAFLLLKSYRRNIKNFNGTYVFETSDGLVAAAACFSNGQMQVCSETISPTNAKITFSNAAALRRFLLSKDQDVLTSILANEVTVDGNLSYIYKFGFMTKDLLRKLERC